MNDENDVKIMRDHRVLRKAMLTVVAILGFLILAIVAGIGYLFI